MKNRKNIIIVLTIVLIMALIIGIARTEYLFKLSSDDNLYYHDFGKPKANSLLELKIDKSNLENFMVIYDTQDTTSVKIKDNIKHVLKYMKKGFVECDIRQYKGIDESYKSVIITIERLTDFQGVDDVINYVSKGGRVFFANRLMDDSVFHNIYQKLGIYELGQLEDDRGIKLISNVLIKGNGQIVDEEFLYNSLLNVKLKKECNVFAISPKGIPALWEYPFNQGKFMVFNGTMLDLKINRGLIVGAISLLNKDFIYPIMNIKLAFIDDFPAPIPKGFSDNIKSNYGRSIPNFYREIWWADILKGAKNYGVKYSSVIIQTYNNRVEPPFEDKDGTDVNSLIVYGREVIKSGGELGIHGYNHQPLAEEGFIKEDMGYSPWESEEDMVASLQEVNQYIKKVYPRYVIRNYVPPSNILSSIGRQAVRKALPELKSISSVYLDDYTDNSYIQEFEVSSDGILELPRLSSGYDNNQFNNWSILNGITSIGVFSHFIHPDDILDNERSKNRSWDEMSNEYDELLGKAYKNYKWLRGMTVSQGTTEIKKYLECETYIEYKGDMINVYNNSFSGDMYFILRTDKKAVSQKNCEVYSIDENVYLIHAKEPDISVNLK